MDACPQRRVHRQSRLTVWCLPFNLTHFQTQLLSVISLLSSENPNLDSPANVDAAKEVRTDFAGLYQCPSLPSLPIINETFPSLQKESPTSRPPKC